MKIIQISDIHLVERGHRLHGLDPIQRFETCIADINAKNADADLCVVTGDLTHNGTIGVYEDLRDCLGALSIPYHLMIGNHDNRANFRKVFPDIPCDENGFVQSVIRLNKGKIGDLIAANVENGSNLNSKRRGSALYTCSCTTPRLISGFPVWIVSDC